MSSIEVFRRLRPRNARCREWARILPFLVASPALAQTGLARAGNACQQTVRHVAHACQDEAKSDYFLALAKCDNLADGGARAACRDQAAADRKETTCIRPFPAGDLRWALRSTR